MTGRVVFAITAVLGGLVMVCGCAPQSADVTLKFSPNDVSVYHVNVNVTKSLDFEQPTLDKKRVEQTYTRISTTFTQEIESVEPDGAAIAKITINDLAYKVVEKNETNLDFDSARQANKDDPLMKILGQSYKIRLTPDGEVSVVDAKNALDVLKTGYPAQVAKSFFSNKSIINRHQVPGLIGIEQKGLKVGQSWKQLKAAPPGLLSPKSYERTYTLEKIEGSEGSRKGYVKMAAVESAVPAPDQSQSSGGMGPLAKVFDTSEEYTGGMVLNVDGGGIDSYNEKLAVTYIVAEPNVNQKPDKGPDTLKISFTQETAMEKIM